jgi:hypothetical protein
MISHHLTQIYQQMLLNESASIPDDVKQAMIDKMEAINKMFYGSITDNCKILFSDEHVQQERLQGFSGIIIEYACTHALKLYKNIDAAVKALFDSAINSLKGDGEILSWWEFSTTSAMYTGYCHRFGKEPVVVGEFVLQILQAQNFKKLKAIGKWDAATYVVQKYLQDLREFDEQLEPLIKNVVMADEYTDESACNLIQNYYQYYVGMMHEPCKWIDAMICNAPDEEEADKILRRIYWLRNKVAPDGQKYLYNVVDFKSKVCMQQQTNEA